jgi:hypothetical protein
MDRSQRHLFLLAFVALAAIVAIVSLTYRLPAGTVVSGEAIATTNVQEAELTVEELGYAPDRLIVGFVAGVDETEKEKIIRGVGAQKERDIPGIAAVLKVPPQALPHVQAALQKRRGVAFAELDYLVAPEAVPNDPSMGSQYYINLMHFPAAWNITTGGTVLVAAPDTGIQSSHPDLAPVLRMDLARNTVDNTNNVEYTHNHGVKTAGALGAATNNGIGIASAAWNVKQIPLKISNEVSGGAYQSDMVEAIRYAADNGARVVSLSYGPTGGSYDTSSTIRSAGAYLESKGGLLFVAAGNSGVLLPAGNAPELLLIGSTTSSDTKSSFSNYGEPIDLVAPGSSVYTTTPGGYGAVSGTSFASPLAASVAALVFAAHPTATPSQVRDALIVGAVDLGAAGRDNTYGHGRVDALGALTAFGQVPVDNTAPSVSFSNPGSGATIACEELAVVNVNDAGGMDRVELRANNALVGTDYQVSDGVAQFMIGPGTLPAGTVSLSARAFDVAGNSATASRSITVSSAAAVPSISLSAPANGASVQDTVSISTTTGSSVVRVEFFANGQLIGSDNTAPYELSWNSKNWAGQSVTLKAVASNCIGNTAEATTTVSVLQSTTTTKGKGGKGGSGGDTGGGGSGKGKNR